MNDDGEVKKYKIIFLGDQGVGKSCILNRFANDKFDINYQATVGLDFHSKSVKLDNQDVRLLLYDTAGQEKFRALIPMYIRDANIILIVYDITNRESYNHTLSWLEEVKDLKRTDAIFALVGNKIDLAESRKVANQEASQFAKERDIIFCEVSAKTGQNVTSLFYKDIFEQILSKQKNEMIEEDNMNIGVKLEDTQENKKNKKKSCC